VPDLASAAPFTRRVLAGIASAGWQIDEDPDVVDDTAEEFSTLLTPPGGPINWTVLVLVRPGVRGVVAYAARPDDVPDDRVAAVAYAITMANFGLPNGHFELDLQDGELRAAAGVDLVDTDLSDHDLHQIVASLFDTVGSMLGSYGDALESVIAGTDPGEAIAAAEASGV